MSDWPDEIYQQYLELLDERDELQVQLDKANRRIRVFRYVAIVLGSAIVLVGGGLTAVAANSPPKSPPGQGECGHGNTNKPCKDDPNPDKGKDCEEHGNKGGVNEDHCKGTEPTPTTPPPTITVPTGTTPTTTTPTTSTPTVPTPPITPTTGTTTQPEQSPVTTTPVTNPPVTTTTTPTVKTSSTTANSPKVTHKTHPKLPPSATKHNCPVGKAWAKGYGCVGVIQGSG